MQKCKRPFANANESTIEKNGIDRYIDKDLMQNGQSFSKTLMEIWAHVPADGLTLRELMEKLGEHGLLMLCMILTVPFLLPVSVPGSSIPFGLIIAFIGTGLLLDRPPWLPDRLLKQRLSSVRLSSLLEKGSHLFARFEKLIHPRYLFLTHPETSGRLNGVALITSAVCLMAPLPLPFSNTLPAYGVLFLSAGMLERDGVAILLGYLMLFLAIMYFSFVWIFGITGLQALA